MKYLNILSTRSKLFLKNEKAFDLQGFGTRITIHLCKKKCLHVTHMSLIMRKPAFCICENKYADQLHGNREADQGLCFHYIDSTIPLLSKYEISSI